MRFVLLNIVFFFLLTSCKKEVGLVNRGDYPNNIGKIITNKCATSGCHDGKSYLAANGYNLETWSAMFSGSYNGSPVIPYSSRFSSLCSFINTYSDLGLQNTPVMPLNKPALSRDEVKLIKDWIDAGAPDINGNIMWGDDPLRKKLYATNQGCDVVTVFDAATQLPMRFIEVGRPGVNDTPHQVRVSADGKYWYVIFIGSNVMEKYRCNDDRFVATIPLSPVAAGTSTNSLDDAKNWNTFVISKDSKRAYCVSLDGRVCAVDLDNYKLLHFINAGPTTHASVLNADNTLLYIGNQQGNYITEWDTSFSNHTDYYLNGGGPSSLLQVHDMILSPNNNDFFITCQQSNDVRVFNIPTRTVTAIINVGTYPQEIIYSSATQQYFVSCTEDISTPGTRGVISRIDAFGYATQKLQCGFQPHGIAVDETKKLLYVLSRNILTSGPLPHHSSSCGRSGFVNFVDLNTFSVLPKKYELSSDPYFIFARP